MILAEFIRSGAERLRSAGIQCADPILHVKQIVSAVLDWESAKLYLEWDNPLTETQLTKLQEVLDRRCQGEPFQYILGYEWFWDSKFEVGPGVLIPRRETELLVEILLNEKRSGAVRVAELGPGSGNIGISVLKERPNWEWNAFELSPPALTFAQKNAAKLLPPVHSYLVQSGDFFSVAPTFAPYDYIVANPPYVSESEMGEVSKEVRHEPRLALVGGGEDGSDVIARLVAVAPGLLKPGGKILFEMGWKQEAVATSKLREFGFIDVTCIKDYSNLPRLMVAKKGA